VLSLSNHNECDAFTELEKLALDYTLCLSATPADVPDELFEKLRALLSEKQLVELTAVIAYENYLARFNRGFAIQAQGMAEGAVCPIPDHHAAVVQS
jgi:alkylhydroperoxidase family enzyme